MMTTLDFAALPPEVNSTRMYTGAGSGPMLAAAAAWHGLAAELRATALSGESILSGLTGEEWFGPASASMAAAAAPYLAWLSATAGQAEQTAARAEAAAGSYETAFAATVPPALVAANRTRLAMLVGTNFLGQNAAAIAATEAEYGEMWAQDVCAMFGYAEASATATELVPFAEPPQTTVLGGMAAQAAALNGLVDQAAGATAGTQQAVLSQLITAVPGALQGLAGGNAAMASEGLSEIANLLSTGTGPAGLENLWAQWGPNANFWNTVTSTGLLVPGSAFGSFLGLSGDAAAAGDAAGGLPVAGNAVAGTLGPGGELGGAVSAGMGNAGVAGKLAVPPAWTVNVPEPSLRHPLGSALGGTPMIAPPPAGTPGMPGVPLGNVAGQAFGRAVPQYGFRPTVVVRPPAAG